MSGLNDYRKMKPFAAGPLAELNFEVLLGELKPGYQRCSTFAADFAIADSFGVEAVEDTFKRALNEWKDNSKMMAEMAMVLIHNDWAYYEIDTALAQTYDRCWKEADGYCLNHYKGEDLEWYVEFTD